MEFLDDVTDSSGFVSPWDVTNAPYNVMRLDPPNQANSDYQTTESWLGSPMVPLIDLQTMKVIQVDTWPPSSWASTIEAHL